MVGGTCLPAIASPVSPRERIPVAQRGIISPTQPHSLCPCLWPPQAKSGSFPSSGSPEQYPHRLFQPTCSHQQLFIPRKSWRNQHLPTRTTTDACPEVSVFLRRPHVTLRRHKRQRAVFVPKAESETPTCKGAGQFWIRGVTLQKTTQEHHPCAAASPNRAI